MSKFYMCTHTFADGAAAEKWWEGMKPKFEKLEEISKEQNEKGFFNYKFMPVATDKIFCLWETKAGLTADDLQKLLDEDVGMGFMTSLVQELDVNLGGPPWESFFETGKAPAETIGNPANSKFFVVNHKADSDEASQKWWTEVIPPRLAAMDQFVKDCHAVGCNNAKFMPVTMKEQFCLWETKAGTEDAALQKLLDEYVYNADWKSVCYEFKSELGGAPSPWEANFKEA